MEPNNDIIVCHDKVEFMTFFQSCVNLKNLIKTWFAQGSPFDSKQLIAFQLAFEIS